MYLVVVVAQSTDAAGSGLDVVAFSVVVAVRSTWRWPRAELLEQLSAATLVIFHKPTTPACTC